MGAENKNSIIKFSVIAAAVIIFVLLLNNWMSKVETTPAVAPAPSVQPADTAPQATAPAPPVAEAPAAEAPQPAEAPAKTVQKNDDIKPIYEPPSNSVILVQ